VFVIGNSGGLQQSAAILFEQQNIENSDKRSRKAPRPHTLSVQNAGSRNARGNIICDGKVWRGMSPVETERALGFPDNYTNIPWRKSAESPDGPRYKALGNSMAVPVMRWIGERINRVDNDPLA
jgi:site-specific DNA-cytosine methylase